MNILNMVYNLIFFSFQNAVCFIIPTYLVPVLFTFYVQGVLKLKTIIPAPKRLISILNYRMGPYVVDSSRFGESSSAGMF